MYDFTVIKYTCRLVELLLCMGTLCNCINMVWKKQQKQNYRIYSYKCPPAPLNTPLHFVDSKIERKKMCFS